MSAISEWLELFLVGGGESPMKSSCDHRGRVFQCIRWGMYEEGDRVYIEGNELLDEIVPTIERNAAASTAALNTVGRELQLRDRPCGPSLVHLYPGERRFYPYSPFIRPDRPVSVFNHPTFGETFKYAAYDTLAQLGPA